LIIKDTCMIEALFVKVLFEQIG